MDGTQDSVRRGMANLLVVYLVWGSTFLAIGIAVRGPYGAPPMVLGFIRMTLGGGILAAMAALGRHSLRVTWRQLAWAGLAGLLLWVGANGLIMVAERHVATGYAALMMGMVPLLVATADLLAGRQRLSLPLATGMSLGVLGLVLLSNVSGQIRGGHAWDVVWLLLAALSQAGSLLVQHTRLRSVAPLVSAAWQEWLAAPVFLALTAILHEPWPHWDAATAGAALYLVVVGALAYASFAAAVRLLPMTIAGTYAFVNPVIAVILGALVLGEPLTLRTTVGGALLLMGVAGVLRSRLADPAVPLATAEQGGAPG